MKKGTCTVFFFPPWTSDTPSLHEVLPAFLALIKAIPWVLKCVFRSVAFSKCLPQTLQVNDPSSWPAGGEAESEPFRELLSSWFLKLTEEDGTSCWPSLNSSLTLWVMNRWRDREDVDVKQAPQCTHCRSPPSVPPRLCWLMCSAKAALSSVVNPQGAQLNPDSGWPEGAEEEEEDRSFFAGLALSVDSVSRSVFTAARRLRRDLKPASCSEELSASSALCGQTLKPFRWSYRRSCFDSVGARSRCLTVRVSWLVLLVLCLSWTCLSSIARLLKVFLLLEQNLQIHNKMSSSLHHCDVMWAADETRHMLCVLVGLSVTPAGWRKTIMSLDVVFAYERKSYESKKSLFAQDLHILRPAQNGVRHQQSNEHSVENHETWTVCE